jgi:hypothetical protein
MRREEEGQMKQTLIFLRVAWIIWVWDPFVALWNELIGYHFCCKNPDWKWTEIRGMSQRNCKNCGDSQVFPNGK